MTERLEVADVPTQIGSFRIAYQGSTVHLVDLLENGRRPSVVPGGATRRRGPFPEGSPPRQLGEYFRGRRTGFDVTVAPETGSDFDRQIWSVLFNVPCGRTVTYGELGRRAGFERAARAVGGAMGRNPIPIVIPCHRVVGETGTLQGFGMGLWRKRWLLDHEGAWPIRSRSAEGPRPGGQRTLDGPGSAGVRPSRS